MKNHNLIKKNQCNSLPGLSLPAVSDMLPKQISHPI